MIVLLEVTIDAVHSFLEMNVLQVNREAFVRGVISRAFDCAFQLVGGHIADYVPVRVEEVPLAVLLEDIAIDPSVPVEVRELSVLEPGVDFVAERFQKLDALPFAAQHRLFGVATKQSLLLRGSGLFEAGVARFWIHMLAVGLQIPPGRSVVAHQHQRAGMHVTDDALARRDRASELMLDGMARFLVVAGFSQSKVVGLSCAIVAGRGVLPRVKRITIVRVDHVARGASARPIITGLIVGPEV